MVGCQSFAEPVLSTLRYNQKSPVIQDYLIINRKCNVKSDNFQIILYLEFKINGRDTFLNKRNMTIRPIFDHQLKIKN